MVRRLASLLLLCAGLSQAFVQPSVSLVRAVNVGLSAVEEESTSPLTIFTGGIGEKADLSAAANVCSSKLKSIKDLGYTGPPKRKGGARPRHRAFGGQTEEPVQSKPNYDPTNPNCVEAWLTQDDMNSKLRLQDGAISDTIFCAFAGGAAFAERDACEATLQSWRPDGKQFDEAAFIKSVEKGRFELSRGWFFFVSFNTLALTGIAFPTNPFMKTFEQLVGQVMGGYVGM